jgi:5-methylcytosine-specific restriction endonuclease McrA
MRLSLLPPIQELDLAAKLLDAAAEALLRGNESLAGRLVAEADLPEITGYAVSLVGKMSSEIHKNVKRPNCLPKEERDPARMPSAKVQEEIFYRDGWRCRFCGIKVISRSARKVLIDIFSSETHWRNPEFKRHSSLYAMAASLDHVFPHGRGGKNEESNFVTACYCCQFGRGEWTLEEVELEDPRHRLPVVDSWDGLSRIAGMKSKKSKSRSKVR